MMGPLKPTNPGVIVPLPHPSRRPWWHLFTTSSSSHLFNKTDFEQYLFKQIVIFLVEKCSKKLRHISQSLHNTFAMLVQYFLKSKSNISHPAFMTQSKATHVAFVDQLLLKTHKPQRLGKRGVGQSQREYVSEGTTSKLLITWHNLSYKCALHSMILKKFRVSRA